ncbi:hypothetical protein HPB51_014693 [Rhipicephalus microplus]|uniref:Uncharacterized protein n=1 Tax=Rhipicephalus microplus TaxID=6941 RepID=A0A9J6DN32_RHIMP|nr:hypothetical protein HPB51_014693 [Rhipicephalus microplus]
MPLQGLVEETSSLVPGVSEKSRQNSSSPSMYDEVPGPTASCRPETPGGERRTASEATEEHDEWAIEDVAVSAKGWPSASSPADAAAADSAAGRESAERHGRNSGSLSGVSEDAAGGNATSASPNAVAQNVSAAESLLGTVTPDLEEDVESETEEEQVLLPSGEPLPLFPLSTRYCDGRRSAWARSHAIRGLGAAADFLPSTVAKPKM